MPLQTVRRVLPHEYVKYRHHLKQLDAESKILRFGYPATDTIINQLCDRFELNHTKHILFCVENNDLEFVAIGHIALEGEMELAFSVLDEYQGQGLGNLLMQRCIQWCRTHNILSGCMVCLSANSVIRHLCNKYGISMQNDRGETLAKIQFDRPDLSTYMHEATDNNLGVVDYLGKRIPKLVAFV